MAQDIIARLRLEDSQFNPALNKNAQALKRFQQQSLSLNGVMNQGVSALTKYAASMTSVYAAVSLAQKALTNNIQTALGFEKSMSSLSALTGMTGSALDDLKQKAIELGGSTTQSASQVADAFKLIGSQMPQLLSSSTALAGVTKEVIKLSEAAGIELQQAASTLAVSINQMGASASDAERYVNVLAAASQKGAGDISWLGEAITNSGTAAKAVGTGYEELVANLEQLAQAGYDAGSAGTALRSIIMNLEKQADSNLKPSVVGLTQAFKNLGEKHLTLSGYQDIVGKLFAAQAMTLADNADKCRELESAITGTNIASEQAATNTNNLDGALKSLSSAWEEFNLTLNDSNSILTDVVKVATDTVRVMTDIAKFLQDNKEYVDGFFDAMIDGAISSSTELAAMRTAIELLAPVWDAATEAAGKYFDLTDHQGAIADGAKAGSGLSSVVIKPKATTPVNSNTETTDTTTKTVKVKAEKDDKSWQDALQLDIPGYALGNAANGEKYVIPLGIQPTLPEGSMEELADQLKSPLVAMEEELARLQEAMHNAFDPEEYKGLSDMADELKEKIDSFTGKAKKTASVGDDVAEAWNNATTNIGKIGQALSSIEDPTAKVAGIVAEAIATIAGTFAASLKGTFTPWDWIAGAAAGTATMIATIDSIKSATEYHADGGMVGMPDFKPKGTDTIPAMLTPGEIVLSAANQNMLAQNLTGIARQDEQKELKVSFSGEKITIAQRNADRRRGRGEYVRTSNSR